ncbi:MAG TPA: hypothetical protein DCZ48_13550 [Methylococcaceae bacterium]|nr:hypothetical protein [Methylococcaceae bacterium]
MWRVFVDLGVRVVNLDVADGAEPSPLFQIEACYQVDYELTAPIEQAALDEFTHFNAVHNIWPFWRQYVFSMANQAGLPCPEIPLKMCLQNHDDHTQEPV